MIQNSSAKIDSPLTLECAKLFNGELKFTTSGGLCKALLDGCFYLQIPEGIDLSPNITLSKEFYKDITDGSPETIAYRGFREREGVYFDREHFQTEHVLVDYPSRLKHFPPEVVATCDAMNNIAIHILKFVLHSLAIPKSAWCRVTGGAIDNAGTHWFALSHYRSERDQMGCAPHKDTGFVTVLYAEQDGLEVLIDDCWVPIFTNPGCFIINFGVSLEILTSTSCRPVHAILHRVRRTIPSVNGDRFSFAAFTNPPASGMLFQWTKSGEMIPFQSVEKFLIEFNAITWNDKYNNFGVK